MKASGHNIFLRLILLLIALTAGLVLSAAVYAENSDGRIATNKINAANYAYAQETNVTSKEGDVAVSEENFPDSVFRNWILNSANLGGAGADGVLTREEISAITSVYILPSDGLRIKSLEGISCFTAITQLIVPNHEIVSLDLTNNTNLTYINCSYNRLTLLKVYGLSKAETLFCEFNYLSELDLTGLTELTTLYSRHNVLKSLDLSTNKKLKFIETFDNLITDIDVTGLSELEFLHIDHNKLTKLDMSKNLNLKGSGFVVRNNDVREIILPVIDGFTVYYDDFAEQDPIAGYENMEWYADELYTQPITSDVTAQGQTLYGKRVPNKYTVNFEGNGGSGLPSPVVTYYDLETALPEDIPIKKGYTFIGWGTDAYNPSEIYSAGESVINLAGKKYNGDKVTLYAQWEAVSYNLKFDINASDASGEMEQITLKYGQSMPLPENLFARPKYDFIGWAYTSDGKVAFTDRQAVLNLAFAEGETVILYAVWELTAEEIAKPYVLQIQNIFEEYSSVQYVAEDWDKLFSSYNSSLQKLKEAGKNEQKMRAEVETCRQALKNVPTLEDRVDEIVSGWRNEFSSRLSGVYNPPLSLGSGKLALAAAIEAAEKAELNKLKDYSTLTDSTCKEQTAALAGSELSSDLARINVFLSASDWIVRAEDACLLPKNEIKSSAWSLFDSITKDYDTLTAEQKAYVSEEVLSTLDKNSAFAKAKEYAVSLITQYHSQFDMENYYSAQQEEISSALSVSISGIENAFTEEEIGFSVTEGKNNMDSVLTKSEYDAAQTVPEEPDEKPEIPDEHPDETPDETPSDTEETPQKPENNGVQTLVIVLSVIAAVAVIGAVVFFIVRKRRRKQ